MQLLCSTFARVNNKICDKLVSRRAIEPPTFDRLRHQNANPSDTKLLVSSNKLHYAPMLGCSVLQHAQITIRVRGATEASGANF